MTTHSTSAPSQVGSVAPAGATSEPAELIHRHVTEENICVLTFDRPNSAANVFDRAALMELNEHIEYVMCNAHLRGLVLTSAKKSIFIAGADLTELERAHSAEELRDMIELGQVVFTRLAGLNVPTVAAIHGACLGGGYEVCLACDLRLASPDKVTKIGLPETQLGILPAWGGSTRLPKLIGLPKALDVILAGKTLAQLQKLKLAVPRWQEFRRNIWEFPDYMDLPIAPSPELAENDTLSPEKHPPTSPDRQPAHPALNALTHQDLAPQPPSQAVPAMIATSQ